MSRKGSAAPHPEVFPAVSVDQIREFNIVFWQAGPVDGFLSGTPYPLILSSIFSASHNASNFLINDVEDKIMNAYMTSDLSYEAIREIMYVLSDPSTLPSSQAHQVTHSQKTSRPELQASSRLYRIRLRAVLGQSTPVLAAALVAGHTSSQLVRPVQ